MDSNRTHSLKVLKRSRLVCLFICGYLLFSFPLITIFDRPLFPAGIPLLYLYLFLVWGLLIGAVYLVIRSRRPETTADAPRSQVS
jgi:hypothetical protein